MAAKGKGNSNVDTSPRSVQPGTGRQRNPANQALRVGSMDGGALARGPERDSKQVYNLVRHQPLGPCYGQPGGDERGGAYGKSGVKDISGGKPLATLHDQAAGS